LARERVLDLTQVSPKIAANSAEWQFSAFAEKWQFGEKVA
jgi:hypothetical protein